MKPNQTAACLRHIASGLDDSQQPNKDLVVRDLKRILSAILGGPYSEYYEWATVSEDYEGQADYSAIGLKTDGETVVAICNDGSKEYKLDKSKPSDLKMADFNNPKPDFALNPDDKQLVGESAAEAFGFELL